MTLKSDEALDALRIHLDAAAGLPPTVKRNDDTLDGFEDTATPGVRWKLAMMDDDILVRAVELGEPPQYELAVPTHIVLAVEGLPGPARDAVFLAAMEALTAALYPGGKGLAIAGKFEDLDIDNRVMRDHRPPIDGRLPIETVELAVQLLVTAPTPFG